MRVPGLSNEELEPFLQGNWVAKLATYNRNESIRMTPLHYAIDDGAILFTTWASGAATVNLRGDARASVLIDDPNPPYKGIHYVGEGEVQTEDWTPDELAQRFGRYSRSHEEAVQFYAFIGTIGERVRIRFRPGKTITWDLSKV